MGKKKRKAATQAGQAMATQRSDADAPPAGGMWLWVVRLCLLVATSLTLYLSVKGSAALPGCGPESNCDQVLSSHWGRWMGIPITVPGLVLYVFFFFQTFGLNPGDPEKARRALNVLVILSMAILTGLSGLWGFKPWPSVPSVPTAAQHTRWPLWRWWSFSHRVEEWQLPWGFRLPIGELWQSSRFFGFGRWRSVDVPIACQGSGREAGPLSPEAEPRPAPPSSGAQTPSTTPSETVIATPQWLPNRPWWRTSLWSPLPSRPSLFLFPIPGFSSTLSAFPPWETLPPRIDLPACLTTHATIAGCCMVSFVRSCVSMREPFLHDDPHALGFSMQPAHEKNAQGA